MENKYLKILSLLLGAGLVAEVFSMMWRSIFRATAKNPLKVINTVASILKWGVPIAGFVQVVATPDFNKDVVLLLCLSIAILLMNTFWAVKSELEKKVEKQTQKIEKQAEEIAELYKKSQSSMEDAYRFLRAEKTALTHLIDASVDDTIQRTIVKHLCLRAHEKAMKRLEPMVSPLGTDREIYFPELDDY